MGLSTSRSRYRNAAPNTVVPPLPNGERPNQGLPPSQRQLRVIREMLEDMKAQTMAGQQITMEKIVAFLGSRIHEDIASVAPRNVRQLSQMVDQLAEEVRRAVPDVRLFGARAEALVVLLSAVT